MKELKITEKKLEKKINYACIHDILPIFDQSQKKKKKKTKIKKVHAFKDLAYAS